MICEQQKLDTINDNTDEPGMLNFARVLGHKGDIPGSGQWVMLSKADQKCWVCNNHIYTVVLWNKRIGWDTLADLEPLYEERMIRKLEDMQRRYKAEDEEGLFENKHHPFAYNLELGTPNSSPGVPVIQGSFTNWNP